MYHTRKDKTFNESSTSDLFQKCDRKNRLHHDKRLYVPRRPAGLLSSIRSNLARQLTTGPLFSISRFPAHPEFYATSKMINVKKHYIYNDNFTLHVSDLNQIHLATDEDKAYGIDHWAKLFKAKTREDLKTQNNEHIQNRGSRRNHRYTPEYCSLIWKTETDIAVDKINLSVKCGTACGLLGAKNLRTLILCFLVRRLENVGNDIHLLLAVEFTIYMIYCAVSILTLFPAAP